MTYLFWHDLGKNFFIKKFLIQIENTMNFASLKLSKLFVCTLLLTALSVATFAKSGTDKTIAKARQAVALASPDDWKTFAESAEKCIKKDVNLKEAAEWLDKSISIKETAYNLKVKGLYYEKNNLPTEALKCYVKSLKIGVENDVAYSDVSTQEKVRALSKEIK